MKNSNLHGLEDNPRFSILQEQESKKKVKCVQYWHTGVYLQKLTSGKLGKCRENLQSTLDNISVLERHQEKDIMGIYIAHITSSKSALQLCASIIKCIAKKKNEGICQFRYVFQLKKNKNRCRYIEKNLTTIMCF
ncbi:hypothetical protein RFI_34056 [Reticulomyxa filosa]|uniref:Uncharacterized protein n=1 Tax=Reticulomyxa filosa TaxID=46433 RepID=X6LP13_RETFI|nr:hypothetical protein RFI_34056 [Reticulomyxa filosa]|eukprot:ETO03354.1 hypothetical protein RFI_34056 [Reticulomyxa filosa]